MTELDQQLVRRILANRTELVDKFHVESLAVFGSVARGTAGQESDLDLLVDYERTPGLFSFLELKKFLEDLVGRPVDLVTRNGLKRQLRERILQEAIRVV